MIALWRRLRAALTWRRLASVVAAIVFVPPLALIVAALCTTLPEELHGAPRGDSIRVYDRHGRLIREVRADDGSRARWVPLSELTPTMIAAIVAAEDQRFYRHRGVDPIAVARAIVTSIRHLRIVSGASTLTMQLARTVRPHPRNFAGKFGEMALALRIDASLTKAEILEQYVNRVDFGPHLRGLAAASDAWLDKPLRALSLGESALLAGLPRGPSLYALNRGTARAQARRSVVLARMLKLGSITEAQRAIADVEPIVPLRARATAIAPHFVEGLVSGRIRAFSPALSTAWTPRVSAVQTTIDEELQRAAEATARDVVARMNDRHVTAASVVVIENASGDILAWVGSPDATDVASLGANDGVLALRQPGSTLKPFAYGQAIETLGFTPATVLPDVELHLKTAAGTWAPRNYDEVFHGPVRLRDALGSSLNVPAAWTVAQLGVDHFLDRLRALGFDDLREKADFYGPALALGDGEVRLLQLTNAYATVARGGVAKPVRFVRKLDSSDATSPSRAIAAGDEHRVMTALSAALVTDMLKDRRARLRAFGDYTPLDFGFEVAAKTGTSKGFRDNWTIGFSSAVTVGVWVGNFDATPMQEVSGISGAAPIFQTVMEAAMRTRAPAKLAITAENKPDRDDAQRLVAIDVCAFSGERADASCPDHVHEWLPASAADSLPTCAHHVAVRVDRRNGLRAGALCGPSEVEVRTFERVAPEFYSWAVAEKRPLVPRDSSPFCPTGDDGMGPILGGESATEVTAIAIRRPLDGTRLVLDPELPRAAQLLEVDVVAPADVKSITLLVDGVAIGSKSGPFVFMWPIASGAHTFVARAAGHADAASIAVHVR